MSFREEEKAPFILDVSFCIQVCHSNDNIEKTFPTQFFFCFNYLVRFPDFLIVPINFFLRAATEVAEDQDQKANKLVEREDSTAVILAHPRTLFVEELK